VRRADKPT